MNYITYSLTNGEVNSNKYYRKVEFISEKIIETVLKGNNKYLNDFMSFISKDKIENLRSKEEYLLEIFLIGIVIKEYLGYGQKFGYSSNCLFTILNKLRSKDICKSNVDNLRGKLATNTLMKRKDKRCREIDIKDFKLVIRWMKATGDFKEEVYRLNNWIKHLENKDKEYVGNLFKFSIKKSEYLYEEAKIYLGEYTTNVDRYLASYKDSHNNREDIIYCGKSELQYFFNMVASETMNKVYRDRFLACNKKKVFTPSCMRQVNNECLSKKTISGYLCISCSKDCNINKLTKLCNDNKIEVYVIPHEAMLFSSEYNENSDIGIIGVACVLNLVSGGFKALRLGFKPQCVALDYCGCCNHWLDEPIMTSINLEKLKKLYSI